MRHFVIIGNKIVRIHIPLALCRTFGASFSIFAFPGLTAGPILCRAFGPTGRSNHQILSFETAAEAATQVLCELPYSEVFYAEGAG